MNWLQITVEITWKSNWIISKVIFTHISDIKHRKTSGIPLLLTLFFSKWKKTTKKYFFLIKNLFQIEIKIHFSVYTKKSAYNNNIWDILKKKQKIARKIRIFCLTITSFYISLFDFFGCFLLPHATDLTPPFEKYNNFMVTFIIIWITWNNVFLICFFGVFYTWFGNDTVFRLIDYMAKKTKFLFIFYQRLLTEFTMSLRTINLQFQLYAVNFNLWRGKSKKIENFPRFSYIVKTLQIRAWQGEHFFYNPFSVGLMMFFEEKIFELKSSIKVSKVLSQNFLLQSFSIKTSHAIACIIKYLNVNRHNQVTEFFMELFQKTIES